MSRDPVSHAPAVTMERDEPAVSTLRWLSLLFVIGAVVLWPYRHFAGDDAYISFRFVRNLSQGQGFAFNPGEPTYGSTAPLWVFLLAGVHLLGSSIEDAAHALNWLFVFVCIAAFWSLSKAYLRHAIPCFIAVLLLIVDPWFVRWSMSGMENAMALSFVVLAVLFQQRLRNTGRPNWVSPLCGALAILTRPEMALFTALSFADTLLFERKRRVKNLAEGAAICLLVVTPWLSYAQAHFGTIVPNTISAKLSRQHGDALVRTLMYLGSFWPLQAAAAGLLVVARGAKLGQLLWRPSTRERWFLPLGWAAALPSFYIVGGAPVAGRYMMLGLPCYLLIGVAAWSLLADGAILDLRHWSVQVRRRLVGGCLIGTLGLVGTVQYKYCWYVTKWPQGMDPRMIELATYLRDHSRKNDAVASDQIGVLGYFSDRYVLDLVGLVSPEMLPYRRSPEPNAVWHYVRRRSVDFLFVIDDLALLTSRDPDYASLEPLRAARVQREGASAVGAATQYYLYRTHWSRP